MSNELKKLSIVGVGPSDKKYIYPLVLEEIKSADIIAGSPKILNRFEYLKKDKIEYELEFDTWIKKVEKAIKGSKVVVLVSGDPGFYSLSTLVVNYFKPEIPKILPGISTLQMAYARIGKNWNNVKVASLHGRNIDIERVLAEDDEIVVLMDSKSSDRNIGKILCDLGYSKRGIYVCSNLGYRNEEICHIDASELAGKNVCPNSILIIEEYKSDKIKFYGIGVGIGGPEMITIRGVKVLKSVNILYVPKAKKSSSSLALDSIKNFVPQGTKILEFEYPMITDRKMLSKCWERAANIIVKEIKSGNTVAFVTIGDPLLYSTYNYILGILKKHISVDLIETIPGINSFSYAASKLQKSLLERDEKMVVLPCSRSLEGYVDILKKFDTVVLMKIGNNIKDVVNLIRAAEREDEAYFFKDMGYENEIIGLPVRGISSLEEGYLSTIIIRREKISGGRDDS
jgi:precorrin-2/cobalt-factor-2 C20-methyltransferase